MLLVLPLLLFELLNDSGHHFVFFRYKDLQLPICFLKNLHIVLILVDDAIDKPLLGSQPKVVILLVLDDGISQVIKLATKRSFFFNVASHCLLYCVSSLRLCLKFDLQPCDFVFDFLDLLLVDDWSDNLKVTLIKPKRIAHVAFITRQHQLSPFLHDHILVQGNRLKYFAEAVGDEVPEFHDDSFLIRHLSRESKKLCVINSLVFPQVNVMLDHKHLLLLENTDRVLCLLSEVVEGSCSGFDDCVADLFVEECFLVSKFLLVLLDDFIYARYVSICCCSLLPGHF